jgi:hypothetical protein
MLASTSEILLLQWEGGRSGLYVPNAKALQNICKFQISEVNKKIFNLDNNTWVVY